MSDDSHLVLARVSDIPQMSHEEWLADERGYRRGYWRGVLEACNLVCNGSTQHNVRLWLFRELKDWAARGSAGHCEFEVPPDCPKGRSEQEATTGKMACIPTAKAGSSFVYAVGDGHGNVKIGVAEDVQKRIRQLQTGNPNRLYLVAFLRLSSRYDADRVEKEAHSSYSQDRVSGEWFALSDSCATQALLEAACACGLDDQPTEVEDRVY